MGRVSNSLYEEIRDNADNGVYQLPIGLPKLQSYIDGARKNVMITLGGTSGSGKSSFALYCYVYKPIMECIRLGENNFTAIIFCLEMTPKMTLSKLVSYYIWDKYGVELGMRDMFSFSTPLAGSNRAIVEEAKEMIDKFETYIRFVTGTVNSKTINTYIMKYYEKKGVFLNNEFIPNNPKHITIGLIDHIGEVSVQSGSNKKTEIDGVADVCKNARNTYGMSWCILQQINRGASAVGRRDRYKGLEMDDFKDSGNVCEKSDIVIGLYYPYRMKDFDAGGYNVKELKQILKVVQVLKGRYGVADISIGTAFYGHSGTFYELPKGPEVTNYNRYKTPFWTREEAEIRSNLTDDI